MAIVISSKRRIYFGLILILSGFLWAAGSENIAFDAIVKIRQSIYSGNGAELFLASMFNCLTLTVTYSLLGTGIFLVNGGIVLEGRIERFMSVVQFVVFILLSIWAGAICTQYFEIITVPLSIAVILFMIEWTKTPKETLLPRVLIAVQVFFSFQWLNIMPKLSGLGLGRGDLFVSIKVTGNYLNNENILNIVGIAFFLPLLLAAFMTAMLYRMHFENMQIVRENYSKEREIETMQAKIMNNRIYQEIHALAHDLKTPLVTIRGLSSLLLLSKDVSKLLVYSERIDDAVTKMNDMISSFLYSNSRQLIDIGTLIDYLRAQIPFEDEYLKFEVAVAENLPKLNVNKVRLARALINLIENALMAPKTSEYKVITFRALMEEDLVVLEIEDNGMGIQMEDLEKIWTLGFSGKNSTGLGLAFAKQTVEENDGLIYLESQYGIGTKVRIEFCAKKGA